MHYLTRAFCFLMRAVAKRLLKPDPIIARPVLLARAAVCCLMAFLFVNRASGQTCPDLNCTSNDVQIVEVYLADANGVRLEPCTVPSNVTAYLWLSLSTNTPRVGVMISGTLQIDGMADQSVSFCTSTPLSGSATAVKGPAVNWACGKAIRLINIFTAWGTGNTDFCSGSSAAVACGDIVSSKCRRYDQPIIVEAPLVAGFSTSASCITGNGVQTIAFTSTSTGGKTPYQLIEWDFTNDGIYDATGATTSFTYPAGGSYTAKIRVTDALNTVNTQTATVIVGTCCIPSTAPASASTDVTNFCPGTVATLSVSGGSLGTGAGWKWYTGSCGGTAAGSGASIKVSPAGTTTYYVRAEGECGTTGCVPVTVNVKTLSVGPTLINRSANNFCPGGSTTLTVADGSLGTGASWRWYAGSCSGVSIGAGPSITVSPAVSTTYYVRAEGDCNTTLCASVPVTVKTVSTAPVSATASTNNFCPGGSTSLSVSGGSLGTGASWKWYTVSCGGTAAGSGASITVSPLVTTTYYVRAEGDCGASACAEVVVTVKVKPNPPAVASQEFCSGVSPTVASLPQGGGSYKWYAAGSGGAPLAAATALATGTYWVSVTVDGCESLRSPVSVTVYPSPMIYTLTGASFCISAPNTGSVTLSNSQTGVWYQLKDAGNDLAMGAAVAGSNGVPLTWNGLGVGSYYVEAVGVNTSCPTQTATARVQEFDCSVFYTLTQGYYGSKNGKSCAPAPNTPEATIRYLLGTTDLVVGTDKWVKVPATADGAKKLNSVLPGGGTATGLPAGAACDITTGCFSYPSYLTKQGKIGNILLSQTLTLSLNSRWDGGKLMLFPIENGWLTTQKMKGCGDAAQLVTDCADGGTISSILMNRNVVDYLGANNTVQDLLDLANAVLGGSLDAGVNGVPSYSDINEAVDAINKSFDEGRRVLDYYEEKQTCDMLSLQTTEVSTVTSSMSQKTVTETAELAVKEPSVGAYPNPYSDKVRFVVNLPVAGSGSLDVYTISGQRVKTVYEGWLKAGVQSFEWKAVPQQGSVLIYVLRIGDKQVTGKLLGLHKR